jgi:KUP system potassium uptake protein
MGALGTIDAADAEGSTGRLHGPLPALALAAIGIVFGDIGTSPLYTMSTVFDPANGLALNPGSIVGVVSLILWSLVLVVSLKYVILIMRASNHGEGGIMALLAMAASSVAQRPLLRRGLMMTGVFGAALFYGDSVITPAISVLSAVEGLEVAAPGLKSWVVPVTLGVLVALFVVQVRGTARIGGVFGPIMVVWFGVLAIVGLLQTVAAPGILAAINPLIGVHFLLDHGWVAFVSLGAVVLALTGAEALYADMGHFGAAPIRLSWFGLVFPALGLNYLGQGALLLAQPQAASSPFFLMFPAWMLYPMIVLATVATVIASQAVISGAFSMTKQAMQIGFVPRMTVVYTSDREIGQIYVPAINWMLLIAVVVSVLAFGSSTALGSAYGIAVTGTMLITTMLAFFVAHYVWRISLPLCILATCFFLTIDAAFFAANLLKFLQGGWFPLLVGALVFTAMSTWKRGRELLTRQARLHASSEPLRAYLDRVFLNPPVRVAGTAVFLSFHPDSVPLALEKNLEHNQVLHERVLFINFANPEIPYVPPAQRVSVTPLEHNCYQIVVTDGFKDRVSLPAALRACEPLGLAVDPRKASYFLSRSTVVPTPGQGMWLWREKLFAAMSHNIGNIAEYLKLPATRVIELGSQVEI